MNVFFPFIPLLNEDITHAPFALEAVAAGHHLGNRDQLLPDTKPAGTFIVENYEKQIFVAYK